MADDTLVLTPTVPNACLLGISKRAIGMDSLWKAIRKLSSENSMEVVRALCGGGKTFGELQLETGLIINDLNHVLYDMKQMGLIIALGERKGERKYHLTSYCVILLDVIERLQNTLQRYDDRDIFDAHK